MSLTLSRMPMPPMKPRGARNVQQFARYRVPAGWAMTGIAAFRGRLPSAQQIVPIHISEDLAMAFLRQCLMELRSLELIGEVFQSSERREVVERRVTTTQADSSDSANGRRTYTDILFKDIQRHYETL